MPAKPLPPEALFELRRRLSALPARSPARRQVIQEAATAYDVSEATIYRALKRRSYPRAAHRVDQGTPRVLPVDQLERYCEVIAALKLRSTNKKGRHLSTAEAIRLLETYGVETPDGFVQAPQTLLKKSTVNRYLSSWGLDWRRLRREPPAVRFEAEQSNDLWQFDISPSDLKHLQAPAWVDETRGPPTLMLYSITDDRSGVVYQEYHCTYGEAVEVALQFLFNAMALSSCCG
jgi:transposase